MFGKIPTKTPEKPTVKIPLGDGLYALINAEDYELIEPYEWYAHQHHCSTYAAARAKIRGRWRTLRMHRLIAHTPPRMITHHLNHNTLDNRRENLLNLTSKEHTKYHTDNKIRVKFEKNTTIGEGGGRVEGEPATVKNTRDLS